MKRFRIGTILRLAALVIITTLVWCYVRDRMSSENWGVPTDYTGDGDQILGWIKAASEFDYLPFWPENIHRLGAPYIANWDDYPMYERILTLGLGILTRIFGIFWTANFAVLFGHITSAISFYLCCRFMRHSKMWAFVGALLFSFTYYNFFRNFGHVLLAYSYTLPWAILSTWVICGARHMRMGDRLAWMCIITGIVMGLSNPYWLNMYLQILGFAILAQFFGKRRKENLKVGLCTLGCALVGFLACNWPTIAHEWAHGKNPNALDRHYFESELYALKPMEFFIPPATHNINALADIGGKYISQVYVRGEITSPYLGVIGIIGLFWIFGIALLRLAKNAKIRKSFPPHALQITWIIVYCAVGGANCLLAFAGLQLFRGSDRYSMFVSTIVMLFLVAQLSRISRKWSTGFRIALAGLALVIGIPDEAPRPTPPADTAIAMVRVKADIGFGQKMEEKIPAGAMVFQLPVMSFPEAVPTYEVSGYEMLKPYIVTKTLHFSFGSVRGRTREMWQWEVEKLPAAQMVAELEKYGFAAIYINRKGYKDHADSLLQQLADAGRNQTFSDDTGNQICVMLKPSPTPLLPQSDLRAQMVFSHGWVIKEHNDLENREWSDGDATMTFFSEPRQPATYSFCCHIGTIVPRHVTIKMDGREIWSGEIPEGRVVPVDISVIGRHGNNKVVFTTDVPAAHTKDTTLPLAFTLLNLQIVRTSGGD